MHFPVGEWELRGGLKAVVLRSGAPGDGPVVGYFIGSDGRTHSSLWDSLGRWENNNDEGGHTYDLLCPWIEPKKVMRYAPALIRTPTEPLRISAQLFADEESAIAYFRRSLIKWPANDTMWVEVEE